MNHHETPGIPVGDSIRGRYDFVLFYIACGEGRMNHHETPGVPVCNSIRGRYDSVVFT